MRAWPRRWYVPGCRGALQVTSNVPGRSPVVCTQTEGYAVVLGAVVALAPKCAPMWSLKCEPFPVIESRNVKFSPGETVPLGNSWRTIRYMSAARSDVVAAEDDDELAGGSSVPVEHPARVR